MLNYAYWEGKHKLYTIYFGRSTSTGCRGQSELGTLEWINFNPDFLIRISTVETFHFSP